MTSEEDAQQEKVTGWSGTKRKYEDQGDTVKRVRVFIGDCIWDDRIGMYRKASWGDPLPMHTLFNQMILPDFGEKGYMGGHNRRLSTTYSNGETEYEDEPFVVLLSHFFPREAAKKICKPAFGVDWDVVYSLKHPRPIWV